MPVEVAFISGKSGIQISIIPIVICPEAVKAILDKRLIVSNLFEDNPVQALSINY